MPNSNEAKEDVQYNGVAIQRTVTPGGHPQDTSQPAFPVYHRKFANPAPLGLFSFAATTWVLSMFNVSARGITHPELVVSLAVAYGGTAQFVAGIWEFAAGNTFGATAFCSYGAFWWSFAIIFIPWFNIQANVKGAELESALGIYLAAWFIFTFIMLMASLRSSIGLIVLFFLLDITFLLLVAFYFSGKAHLQTAGGVFGIATAAVAWYVGAAGLLSPETALFTLPVGDLSRKD
ncbi:putative FUN34-transmembrane protein [Tilletiaria anomala UBC 951]|uniref:Putative FUN34-transmembrane protein n=1 Tax=Tilletiaria anomala (strain ATCC 24038 / CBS 436.72 / UBC 951) TaxID=1037660 RepID=A0A066WQQ1_TILAU|nr:putative FUN34-transmembrane protein [Tilletiaria anomala UBC 951]KDN52970.1 putative FUN34-transmembrane protein [Tilletiaria anomala UBC 951]